MKAPDSMTMKQFASGGERLFAEIPTGLPVTANGAVWLLSYISRGIWEIRWYHENLFFRPLHTIVVCGGFFVFNSNIIYIAALRRNGEKYEQKNFIAP